MKVLVSNWLSSRGGEEKHVVELVQWLHDRPGVEVLLAAPRDCAWKPELEALPRLTWLDVPFAAKLDPVSVLRVARHLRRLRPDVVHVHGARAGWLVRLAALAAGYPKVVWTMQLMILDHVSRQPGWTRPVYSAIEAFLNRRTARIITVSEDLRKRLLARDPRIEPARVTTVHNAVADPWSRRGGRADAAPGRIRCVAVGKLQPEKGHDVLIDAVASLPEAERPLVDIVGEGLSRQALEERIRKHGLEGTVRLLGFQRDPTSLLAGYDVFLMPSRYEGIPLSMLEGMAMGLPVVGSAVNGIPEAIDDGVNGILVPADDPAALAAAIRRLGSDPALRERLGAEARRTYLARFTGDRIYGAIYGIYETLAA